MTTLADPACLACIVWEDGDPACPQHGGTYQEGVVARRAPGSTSAYLCLDCDD